jgi:RNA polymerase sigma-70 factor, ECF subfamily
MARYSQAHTDAQLIAAAVRDPGAFGELYRRRVGSVHAWFARRAGRAASDLIAETFAQAWLSRGSFRDQRDGSALP